MSPPPPAGSLKAVTITGADDSNPLLCYDEKGLWLIPFLALCSDVRGRTRADADSLCELVRLQKRWVLVARVGVQHIGPGSTVTVQQAKQSPELQLMNAGRLQLGRTLSAKVLHCMGIMENLLADDTCDYPFIFMRPQAGIVVGADGILDIIPDSD